MGSSRHQRVVAKVEDIPVYPEFVRYKNKGNSSFNAFPLCEDENGAVCFPSDEMKQSFLEGRHDG